MYKRAIKKLSEKRDCIECGEFFLPEDFYPGRAKCRICISVENKLKREAKKVNEKQRYDRINQELEATRKELEEHKKINEELSQKFKLLMEAIDDSKLLKKEFGFDSE